MEDATPIYQLQNATNNNNTNDSRKAPLNVMSYNDILKSMNDDVVDTNTVPSINTANTIQQSQINNVEQLPESNYYMPSSYMPPPTNHINAHTTNTNENASPIDNDKNNTFQNEMLMLLGVYIIIHTTQFQQWVRTKIPGIVHENTGTQNIVGTLLNGLLVIIAWNVSKKFLLKYMKDL